MEGKAVVAGVLSGTSADGIDVALVRFPDCAEDAVGRPSLIAFDTLPFPDELAPTVRAVLDGEVQSARSLARLHRDLGLAFGRAARAVADRSSVQLGLVASHGLTVYHHDGEEAFGTATLQLGCGDHVAAAAGSAAASDFRQADLAAGGEGAPISALADGELFTGLDGPLAILNLGGLGNLTVLYEEDRGLSFDTGPAGSLLDGLARRFIGRPFDEGGARARAGNPRYAEILAAEILSHPFFSRRPPRSTGRDSFGETWIDALLLRLEDQDFESGDLLASAVDVVARTVALALEQFVSPAPPRLLVAGGGVHNQALLAALQRHCSVHLGRGEVRSSADFGIDPDAREALVFAVLGARCLLGLPSSQPWATGARRGAVYGKLSQKPREGA